MFTIAKLSILVVSLAVLPASSSAGKIQPNLPVLAKLKVKKTTVNFEATPVVEVVKWISKKTGKNFIVEDSVRNYRLTILSGSPVTIDEAYQAFLDALRSEGMQIEEMGKFYKISRKKLFRSSGASKPVCEGCDAIRQIDDTTWSVPGNLTSDGLINNMSHQARIVPTFQDGKPSGFKLFSIRPKSLYTRLGFKNGDIIHKINGQEITSPDKALEVYSQIRKAKVIKVDLSRKGKHKQFTFKII